MSDGYEIEVEEAAAENPPAWRGPYAFRAFRHRNFALLWTGQLISLTGTWMQGLALPFLVYHLTGSKSLLGIVAAASLLPSVIVALPAGVIADRFSKRRIVLITQSLLLLQALTLSGLTFAGLIRPWQIVALGAFNGFVNSLDMPTRQAMVVELVGKEDLQNAVALNSSMFNLTRIAGPFVGGVVYWAVGPAWCFMINAVSYLGAIVGIFLMKNIKSARRARRDQAMFRQIREGLVFVWNKAIMRDMLLMTAISQLVIMPYGIFFPVYATKIFSVGTKGQGMMSASVGVGALTAAMLVSVLGHRFKEKTIVFTGGILAPLGLIAFSRCATFHACLTSLVLVGIGMMLFMAASNTIIQGRAPAGLGGRVMSLRALVMFFLAAVGSFVMAKLSEIRHILVHGHVLRFDVQGTILLGASIGLISSIYFAIASRMARERQTTAAFASEEAVVDLNEAN